MQLELETRTASLVLKLANMVCQCAAEALSMCLCYSPFVFAGSEQACAIWRPLAACIKCTCEVRLAQGCLRMLEDRNGLFAVDTGPAVKTHLTFQEVRLRTARLRLSGACKMTIVSFGLVCRDCLAATMLCCLRPSRYSDSEK